LGKDLEEARAKAYEAAGRVGFEGKYYRHDIAL
jgi:phosphoribosylamine-glycine ligase